MSEKINKQRTNYDSLVPLSNTNFTYRIQTRTAWFWIAFFFLLSLLPWSQNTWTPDLLLLVICFFCAHRVKGVGLFTAFVFGLVQDVQILDLLGVGALHYLLTVYGVEKVRSRMMHFNGSKQMIQLLPVFIVSALPAIFIRSWYYNHFNPNLLIKVTLTVILWGLLTYIYEAVTTRLFDQQSL